MPFNPFEKAMEYTLENISKGFPKGKTEYPRKNLSLKERLALLEELAPVVKWMQDIPNDYGSPLVNKYFSDDAREKLGPYPMDPNRLKEISNILSAAGLPDFFDLVNRFKKDMGPFEHMPMMSQRDKFVQQMTKELQDTREKVKSEENEAKLAALKAKPSESIQTQTEPAQPARAKGMKKSYVTFEDLAGSRIGDTSNPQSAQTARGASSAAVQQTQPTAQVDLSNPQAVQSLLQEVSREAKAHVDENRKAALEHSANQMIDRQSTAAARSIEDQARRQNRQEATTTAVQNAREASSAEQDLRRITDATRASSPARTEQAQAAPSATAAQGTLRAQEVEDDLRNLQPHEIYNLGREYFYGLNGKIKSPEKGFELLNLADSLGSLHAPFALGRILQRGQDGIASDPSRAREYFQKSFTRGYRPSETALGSTIRAPYEEAIRGIQTSPDTREEGIPDVERYDISDMNQENLRAPQASPPAPESISTQTERNPGDEPFDFSDLNQENLRAVQAQRGSGYDPDVETASTAYRTMRSSERDAAARALANMKREERLNETNPYTQRLYQKNAPAMRAVRTELRKADEDVQDQLLNDIAPEYVRHNVQSIPAGVDTEAAAREQAIKMMLNLINHHEEDFPIEQMFAADDPNKLLAEEQIVDFLKARYNLNDPAKLQRFMDRSHQRDASIGKTYQELMNEDSILGKSDPYLREGVRPISSEDINAYSSQNTRALNDVFRRQALERFEEEAQERRESFENNLRNQFGGFNWFNSLRREKQKQFENQERKMRRDLDDRLMREERMRETEERNLGAKLLSEERQRNLTGADQMGKLASVSNIARASAAANMQAFNDMQESKHLGALNTRRTLGQAQTQDAQNKLNARLQQKRAMEEANRRRPADLFGQLQGAPIPNLPYSAAPLPTPKPLNSMGQDVRDINRMPQQAQQQSVNPVNWVGPAIDLAKNIFGGSK